MWLITRHLRTVNRATTREERMHPTKANGADCRHRVIDDTQDTQESAHTRPYMQCHMCILTHTHTRPDIETGYIDHEL